MMNIDTMQDALHFVPDEQTMEYVRLGRSGLKVSRPCPAYALRDFVRREEAVIATQLNGPMRTDANAAGEDAVAALSPQPIADEIAALEAPDVPHAVAGFSQ
jgi:hypothetical protein